MSVLRYVIGVCAVAATVPAGLLVSGSCPRLEAPDSSGRPLPQVPAPLLLATPRVESSPATNDAPSDPPDSEGTGEGEPDLIQDSAADAKEDWGAVRIVCDRLGPEDRLEGRLVLYPPDGGEEVFVQSFDGTKWTRGGLVAGRWRVRLVPMHSPWLPCERDFWIGAGATEEVELDPARGQALEGVVLQGDGSPAAEAEVTASYSWPHPHPEPPRSRSGRWRGRMSFGGGSSPRTAGAGGWSVATNGASLSWVTDPRGRFRIEGLPTEGARIRVDYEGATFDRGEVHAHGTPIEIRLPPDPPSLAVRIADPGAGDRRRPWGVEVWGNGLKTPRRAEVQEVARFRNLSPGDYVVLACRPGPRWGRPEHRGLAQVQVPASGGTEVVVETRLAGTAKFQPVTARSGEPIRGVEAHALVGGLLIPKYWWGARADGEFSFAPDVDFVLRLSIEGREPVEIPLRLAPGETRDLGEIRMRATGTR